MSSLTRNTALTALFLFASLASAAEDVGAIPNTKQGVVTGVTALIVFALAAAFLGAVVWPKLTVALDERANKIRSEIKSAEDARQQAKEALAEYERNLAEARAEAQKMLDATRSQQTAMAADLKAKADADLNMMREKAKADIEAAKKQALAEIYTESVMIATAMAGRILEREVSVADQQRLIDESLAELKAAGA